MALAGPSKFRPLQPLLDASASARRIAKLPQRNVVEIAGPDAKKFVKGLFCNDVDDIGGGYSGFLNASGRVIHSTFIVPVNSATPTYLITHNPSSTPLAKILAPFKLRSKVRIRDVTEQYDVYSAWGPVDAGQDPERIWKFGSGGAAEATWTWQGDQGVLGLADEESGCWDLRAGFRGGMGRHVVVQKGKQPSLTQAYETGSIDDYHLHRMLLGVPEDQVEIQSGVSLPLESCMDIQGGVDFRKGCYLGQELTVRTYHTGATRKRILPIALFPTTADHHSTLLSGLVTKVPIAAGILSPAGGLMENEITYYPPPDAPSQRPRPAGKILSLHPSVGQIGLGMVRLEFAERSWWSSDIYTLGQWLQGGRLLTSLNGQELGVYVDKGEAYGAALESLEATVEEAEA